MSTRGRRPAVPLTRERVLRAALHLADRDGIESLSMRRLARSLSVQAMSLYNHVAGKEEIIDGIVDLVVGEIRLPDESRPWKSAMRDRAVSAHRMLLRHPWATMEIVSRINIGPAMLAYVEATLGCLFRAGFSYEAADHAWNAMDSYIYGFTLQELSFPFEAEKYREAAGSYLHRIPADRYPHLNGLARHILEGRYDGLHDFAFGFELILDGLERYRSTDGPPRTR